MKLINFEKFNIRAGVYRKQKKKVSLQNKKINGCDRTASLKRDFNILSKISHEIRLKNILQHSEKYRQQLKVLIKFKKGYKREF